MPTIAENEASSASRLLIALVTIDDASYSSICPMRSRRISGSYKREPKTLIKGFVDDPELRAMIFDLDSIGDGPKDGVEVLQEIRALREDIVLVALSSSSQRSIPVMASRAGADEFFLSPPNPVELALVLVRAVEKRALELEDRRLVEQLESRSAFCGMIGGSNAMQKLYQTVQAVADSNTTVLLRGESGTGKELIAQAIVQSGNRAEKPFVCLNCSALPDTLMESELFGYEKGAFTGADSAKPGLIETAQGGTLFLDEITTLPSQSAEQTFARSAGTHRAAPGRSLRAEDRFPPDLRH